MIGRVFVVNGHIYIYMYIYVHINIYTKEV